MIEMEVEKNNWGERRIVRLELMVVVVVDMMVMMEWNRRIIVRIRWL